MTPFLFKQQQTIVLFICMIQKVCLLQLPSYIFLSVSHTRTHIRTRTHLSIELKDLLRVILFLYSQLFALCLDRYVAPDLGEASQINETAKYPKNEYHLSLSLSQYLFILLCPILSSFSSLSFIGSVFASHSLIKNT